MQPAYREALPRYLTALDPAFTRAKAASEFEFLLTLFRVGGMQGADWDPYETTVDAISRIVAVHAEQKELPTQRHLQLWLYGHILEASTPSEILANLIDVSGGGRFQARTRFPSRGTRPPSPGEKLLVLRRMAEPAGLTSVTIPLGEAWNRELRNAVFHADYALHGSAVRTAAPVHEYDGNEIDALVNKALAYHVAVSTLWAASVASYETPVEIPVHPGFSGDPDERATVIVRGSYGAIGVKDAWTMEELRRGKIPFAIGRFYPDEIEALERDPLRAILPARPIED